MNPVGDARALQQRLAREMALCAAGAIDLPTAMAEARAARETLLAETRADLLSGDIAPDKAGRLLSTAAERDVAVMLDLVRAEIEAGEIAVLALGDFGGQDIALDSALPLLVVYSGEDAPSCAIASGLFAALAQGVRYQLDLKLRPDGFKGPAATSIARLAAYYRDEATTPELMALTRARVIAGDAAFGRDVLNAIFSALEAAPQRLKIMADIVALRAERDSFDTADTIWDVTHTNGGQRDLDLLTQALQVEGGLQADPHTDEALQTLARIGLVATSSCATLRHASTLMTKIRHMACALELTPQALAQAGDAQLAPMLKATSAENKEELERRLAEQIARVRRLADALLDQPRVLPEQIEEAA